MTPRAAVFVLFALAALSDRGGLAVDELKDHYKTLEVARTVTDDAIKVPIDRSRDDCRGAPLSSSSCDDPDRVISFSLSVGVCAPGRDWSRLRHRSPRAGVVSHAGEGAAMVSAGATHHNCVRVCSFPADSAIGLPDQGCIPQACEAVAS